PCDRHRPLRHAQRRDAGLLQGTQRPPPKRTARRLEELSALARAARPGARSLETVLRRKLRFLLAHTGRPAGAPAALETVQLYDRRSPRRSRRPGLGQAELSAGGEGEYGQTRRSSRKIS